MIQPCNPVRFSLAISLLIVWFGNASAMQSPLEPMPIGVNESVSIDQLTPSPVPPAEIFQSDRPPLPTEAIKSGSAAETDKAKPANIDPTQVNELPSNESLNDLISTQAQSLATPESLPSSLKLAVVLGILSLAPAIVLMTTCYVRLIVVLTLLRQAFGVQQLPPTQVLTALSLFVTLLVMTPVWNRVKTEAIDPYTQTQNAISWDEAWQKGIVPIKDFMLRQIRIANNEDSIVVFYQNLPRESPSEQVELPERLEDVPVNIVLPAFLISELKVAFLLGFQIYLPFLILDLVVSSVTVSMGMVMLPPTMISFPMKLILFVMVDGWNLVLGMLLQSFG